jgi:hypothetical protein
MYLIDLPEPLTCESHTQDNYNRPTCFYFKYIFQALPEECYVIVAYDDKCYLGKTVTGGDKDTVNISCCKISGRNKFVWPGKRDECLYEFEDIEEVISKPTQRQTRSRKWMEIEEETWQKYFGF